MEHVDEQYPSGVYRHEHFKYRLAISLHNLLLAEWDSGWSIQYEFFVHDSYWRSSSGSSLQLPSASLIVNLFLSLLSMTVSRELLKWQASLMSSLEYLSCFSGKLKVINPSVKGKYDTFYCFVCLLRQMQETGTFYHIIMSCKIRKIFLSMYALKNMKIRIIYNNLNSKTQI